MTMVMTICARVHPCDTSEGYNGFKLTKHNVQKIVASPAARNVKIRLNHQEGADVGEWLSFHHDPETDDLIGVGKIDDSTALGRYAIAGILDNTFPEFSIGYTYKQDALEKMAREGVRKQNLVEVSLCAKGAFPNTKLEQFSNDPTPTVYDRSLPREKDFAEQFPKLPILTAQREQARDERAWWGANA